MRLRSLAVTWLILCAFGAARAAAATDDEHPPGWPAPQAGWPVLQPAPSADAPVPPPILAPPPAVAPTEWRPHPRYDLVLLGGLFFGVGYSLSLLPGLVDHQWQLDVPVVGPLMEARTFPASPPPAAFAIVGLVLDATVQAGGVALLIAGGSLRQLQRVPIR